MRLILEPRYLFDGSVVASLHHGSTDSADSQHHTDTGHTAPNHDQASSTPKAVAWDEHAALPPVNPTAASILFVDTHVANWQTLVSGIDSNVQVITIDANHNGIAQVTRALEGYSGLTSIQFLTYGTSGSIELGNSAVNSATLTSQAQMVASWRSHLAGNADIVFWGCDVGAGSAGQNFLDTVHSLTGVGVGASTDATGAKTLGGNWDLEATVGTVDTKNPFSADAIAAYDNVLDSPIPTVTISGPTNILLGSTFSETVTFQNTASNGVGYGPFIDVFVPSSAATQESASLTSATYFGLSLSYSSVTLSTSVAGHTGVLGASHPLALDSSGQPLFVAAPTGFHAGDKMYVLSLPFGSYTPGQPAASITLNFSLTNTSALTAGQGFKIAAEGGFQYGADALNNPATDPSIRGTAGNPGNSGNADGLVTAASNVTLVDVSAQFNTNPGESETATGSSFPGSYVITLTPAPGTATDALTNFDFTFTLPNDVQYTGGAITVSPGSGSADVVVHNPSSSTPGGTFEVNFTTLKGPTASTISIPVFVSKTDSLGTSVLDSAGDPQSIILHPTYTYTANNWTPVGGSFVNTAQSISGAGPVDGSGNGTDAGFTAKSLAVQVTSGEFTDNGTTGLTPTDVIAYTIHFQLSDYYNLNNLSLADILGDGMTLDPTVAPTLNITRNGVTTSGISFGTIADAGTTVNGQLVVTSGSNSSWDYSRDNITAGTTAINFNVGQLLSSELGSSLLQGGSGGTYGTVTFYAKALDKYTKAFSGQSLREGDSVTNSVTGTGTLINPIGSATIGSMSDNSSGSDTVPKGNLALSIVAINGVATGGGTANIKPGDNVTYALTYNLTTGDYGSLNMTGYLPLPVFNVPGSLSADNVNPYPSTNSYKVVSVPSGGAVQSVTSDATGNSINFSLGTLDDTTNAANQKVQVYFTLTASNKPFADGLALTTEGQSHYTNAASTNASQTAIAQQTLSEPILALKTGIVSLVGDGGGIKAGTYTVDGGGAASEPSSIFAPAQGFSDSASDAIFTNNTPGTGIPTTIGNAENLNVSGVDGSDTVRVVTTVQNTGNGNAFDVTLKGVLPSGYTASDISNFQIERGDGTVLAYTKPNGTGAGASEFFTAGGILVDGAGGASTPALFTTGDPSHRDILFVVYDLTLSATQAPAAVLTATSSVVNWANVSGGVVGGNGFVSSGTPVGEAAANITDNATATVTSATLSKAATAGNNTGNVALPNIVPGETITYTVTYTLPEGQMSGSDITLTDVLPANMVYVASSADTVLSSGISVSGGTPGVSYNAGTRTLTVDLGSAVTNTNTDASGTVTITYQAQLLDGSNVNNTSLTNSAHLHWSGTTLNASTTLTEKDPNVTVAIIADKSNPLYSNEVVTYTLTITDTGGGSVPAQDLTDVLSIPGGLTYNGDLTQTGGPSATVNAGAGTIAISQLTSGQSMTFTFTGTVHTNLAPNTALSVAAPATWTSMPGVVTNERSYNGTGSKSLSVGQLVPSTSIVGESNNTSGYGTLFGSSPKSAVNATVGDIVRMHAYVQIPEGSNANTLLDMTLPTGLQFLNDGTTKIALASPNGDITSSTIDPAGNTSGLQVTEGSSAINAGTYTPTYTFASGNIDTSTSGHVKFDLGTVANNDGSSVANYAVIEFNAIVKNVSGNVDGAVLTEHLTVAGQTSSDVTVTVKEPHITIVKTVTGISGSTVSYQLVLTNTGDATAYGVSLSDPESSNESTIAGLSQSGTATSLNITSGNGTSNLGATMNLAAGASETFAYHVTVTDPTQPVPNSIATTEYNSLSAATETLAGSTTGTAGSSTGGRTGPDGASGPNSGLNNYVDTATLGLGTASGRVWQDLGSDTSTFGGTDTALSGITVTAASPGGITQTTTTDSNGNYVFILPAGSTTISLPSVGSGGLGSNETLVADPHGTVPSNPATASVTVSADAHTGNNFVFRIPDTAPTISNWGSSSVTAGNVINYTEGGSAVVLCNIGSVITDSEIAALGDDFGGTQLVIQRYNSIGVAAPNSHDNFTSSQFLPVLSSSIASHSLSGGVLTITFANGATAAQVGQVLDSIAYSNTDTNTNQLVNGIQIGAKIDDHNIANFQGMGGNKTSAPVFVTVNLLPSGNTAIFTEPNDTNASAAAIAVNSSLIISDPVGTTLAQATVQITGNLQASEDVLTFTGDGNTGNITSSYDASTGLLTLTSSGHTATIAQWQAALQLVKYYDSSDTPNTSARTVAFTIYDSTIGTATTANVTTLSVVAVNDSPVLNNGVSVSLVNSTEDASGAPSGVVGTLVTSLVGDGSGPNNVTDPDGVSTGIAIVSADTTVGHWWYSTDGGTTWIKFADSSQTAISATNALHLVANANTRIYFQPTTADWNGTLATALTIRAWDRFDSVANGTLSALPSDSALGSGANTLASAYSSATKVLSFNVNAVNDAPIASGSASLAATAEDTSAPAGDTVANLFGGNFSDTADQQLSGGNPNGSLANTLAGIAIVTNTTPVGEGVWRYSTDNGTTWTAIPTTLSGSSALILPSTAKIDFLPTANFNGAPPPLTVRLIDSSNGAVSVTTGVDVSTNGGTTAISAATVDLSTSVTSVNDAPIASGNVSLPPVDAANRNPAGETVTHLFGSHFDDNTDQQHTGSNPTGSLANSFAGIAITGDHATAGQGVWRYSTDNGATWTAIPTIVSDSSAILLPITAKISFLSASGYAGMPGALTVRLVDDSSGPVTVATGVDVSVNGGTTPYSGSTMDLSTKSTVQVHIPPTRPTPNTPPVPPYGGSGDSSGLPPISPTPFGSPDDGGDNFSSLDKMAHEPYGVDLWLAGAVDNRFVIVNQKMIVEVPPTVFRHTNPSEKLTFEATLPDGSPLPNWIEFDSHTLTFSGTPQEKDRGSLSILITAHDQHHNKAEAQFRILIGDKVGVPVREGDKSDGPHDKPAVPDQKPAHKIPPAAASDKHSQAMPPKQDFSEQLRQAGYLGNLTRARQFLDTISNL